jgi:tricarballylate dehydrogenase
MVPYPNPTPFHIYDVIFVGDGNAGLVEALLVHEAGARVALVECAPKVECDGSSRFGAISRVVHNGYSDIKPLLYPSDQNKIDLAR